ncbi:MAG: cytochrome C, partial [Alphaproteobacteria bacterium]|nr:cytochrome C [Alphaproteobacteria bacterium]
MITRVVPNKKIHAAAVAGALLLGFTATPALAVPAFAVKTGQPCAACHVGGFGPQLTPFGREFKLEGFTMDAGSDAFPMPVSGMVMSSFNTSAKAQEAPPADHYADNNNFSLDQASLFVAGGIGNHFGGLAQVTYNGVGRSFSWDNTDIRVTDRATLSGNDVLFGLSVNNNPGLEDVWNTLPAWGFPYDGSSLAPAPATNTVFNGAFAQGVVGTTAYAYWNSSIYTAVGLYWTPSNRFLSAMGASFGPGPISGVAPYFRLAYQKDYGDWNYEVGAFGFFPDLYPGGDMSTGKTDAYSDYGIDGSYQFLGDSNNIYTLNARYTHEAQSLNASYLLGNVANLNDSLDDLRLDASYYWHNEIGGTVQLFNTWGSSDALLYAGNSTFKPD